MKPEIYTLDSRILEIIGYTNKRERDQVLLELYRATFKLIEARLQKAQSMKGAKTQRNKVEVGVYVDQLVSLLVENKILAKNTLTFAKQIEKQIKEITSETKLQKKILNAYWREKFGEFYDKKAVMKKDQPTLF